MLALPELLDRLKTIPGSRLLDVATGGGQFITLMLEALQREIEIVGIDRLAAPPETPNGIFKQAHVSYQPMDASALTFPDASFDIVTISNSLHHMPDPQKVLAEMGRVLKPGGTFIISEMYRDGQTEEQLTHVAFHDWMGTVDRALGVTHNKTYTRAELQTLAESVGLRHLEFLDYAEMDDDPKDADTLSFLHARIVDYLERAQALPNYEELQCEGEGLHQRLDTIGFRRATTLVALGQK